MEAIQARKYHIIESIMKIDSEEVLITIEEVLKEIDREVNNIDASYDNTDTRDKSLVAEQSISSTYVIGKDGQSIKSYAGIWEDMPEQDFQEYLTATQEVSENLFTSN